jgi:hypothetical protein
MILTQIEIERFRNFIDAQTMQVEHRLSAFNVAFALQCSRSSHAPELSGVVSLMPAAQRGSRGPGSSRQSDGMHIEAQPLVGQGISKAGEH